jgi:DNA polymerase epsilon subunit 1
VLTFLFSLSLGYVMRKGARWRSMEMAGIVTKTGADIITQARILVEQIGRPLELDTDGIWCILPKSFPDVYTFKLKDGSKIKLEYPCVMLNADVHANFTNHQYQTVKDPITGTYETRSECSIFFEVDGPYRCMVIPASTEEGKLLKKRYAVFNFDGSMAELKGFELKRRGELELIKTFQAQVFERFLDGGSLEECYASVADIANHWIDVLDTQGESLDDDEVIDLISENRSMSRQLEDYGDQKGTSQTTARRLGEFLGSETIKDKGLNCKFVIAEQPYGAPVTERAIPTAIWKAEPAVMKHYLRKWLKAPGMEGDAFDIRNVLDWEYYIDRLAKTIQKIITIPAALQKIANPVPRVAHPSWLEKKVSQLNDRFKQQTITSMFQPASRPAGDIEDIGTQSVVHSRRRIAAASSLVATNDIADKSNAPEPEKVPRVSLSKENFGSWLKQKKARWRQRRTREKRLRNAGDASSSTAGGGVVSKRRKTASMERFVRDAARVLTQSEWQVIEMHPMTNYDTRSGSKSTGEMVMWVMVGMSSLQKIRVSVPRTVYVSARNELQSASSDITTFKRVEKNLPHGKTAPLVYEIVMPEYVFQNRNWADGLMPVDRGLKRADCLISIFETGVPLVNRALNELGCVAKVNPTSGTTKGQKSYSLEQLSRVDRPSDGEYLHISLSYKRIFVYFRLHPRTRVGVIGVLAMNGGSGSFGQNADVEGAVALDITRPTRSAPSSFDVSATCHFWIVKPGSKKGQKNVASKHCDKLFAALLETVHESSATDNDYACVSPASSCKTARLSFVERESEAYQGVNEVLNGYSKGITGPTFLLVNSSKSVVHMRRYMPALNSFPVVSMPFPPGPAHNASMSTMPSLNWEQPAIHLCLEAFLYANVVSWPNRVSYARYGQVPVGNLGDDENLALYDVSLSRFVQRNRTLSWGSPLHGKSDTGLDFLPTSEGGVFPAIGASAHVLNEDEIWADDDDLISPVIRKKGESCGGVYVDWMMSKYRPHLTLFPWKAAIETFVWILMFTTSPLQPFRTPKLCCRPQQSGVLPARAACRRLTVWPCSSHQH